MNRTNRRNLLGTALLAVCSATAFPLHAQQSGGTAPAALSQQAGGSFVHAVYFWLRPDLSEKQRDAFVEGLRALRGIETVQHGWIGEPAPTDRPIIERSYSYALTLVFADAAGQDTYQVHPVHDRFREEFGDFWSQVVIYDSVESSSGKP